MSASARRPSSRAGRLVGALVACGLLSAPAARAGEPPPVVAASADPRVRPSPVRVDWAVDGALTGGALALWLGSELAKDDLAPPSCRWCTAGALDTGARDAVVWSSPGDAKHVSDALVVGVPLGVAVYDGLAVGSARAALPDVLLIGEAIAISGLLAQGTKLVAARQRPYATYGTLPGEGTDDRLSFYSAHTTITFSAVAAGGMLAQLRGDPAWPWVYGVGFSAAAATGYFRMAADKHWLTDVLAGAATGTAVGLAVPWLHRSRPGPDGVRVAAVPGGAVLTGRF